MASKITELGAERFRRSMLPSDIAPRDALLEALRQIDSGELNVTHIVVMYVGHAEEDNPADQYSGYIQAGRANLYTRLGVIDRVRYMMNRTADEG